MADRDSRWRWPACCGLAVVLLLLACFGVPRRWIEAFFSPLGTIEAAPRRVPAVLRLLPVPEILTGPEATGERTPEVQTIPETWPVDPAWWRAAWQVHVQDQAGRLLVRTRADSLLALARDLLGAVPTLAAGTAPDSLSAWLALWSVGNQDRFERLKPYLEALRHRRQAAAILNQAAWIHDEFLGQEITVPDPGAERGR